MFLNEIIKQGTFEQLSFLQLENEKLDELLSEIYRLGVVEENILSYYVCCACIMNDNISEVYKAKFHNTAAVILTMGLNYIGGAYVLGFYHMKQAMKLDLSNIEYRIYTLSTFVTSPEIDVEKNDVMEIVNEVLKKEPQNEIANRILKEFA